MNYKIAFIILHYQTLDETIKCIESIKNRIDTENYEIIIVDNCSPNGSGKILYDKYNEIERYHVLLNEKNLGFSAGNNIGFRHAKKIKCDFIAMINNDTCLITDNFFSTIINEYQKSQFSVMGPKILLKNNEVCTMDGSLMSLKKLKKYIRNLKIKLFLNYLHLDKVILSFKENLKKDDVIPTCINIRRENVVLHGCALIFSPIFINKFDGLDEKTFLYCEEELLFLKLKRNNMKSVYNPELLIYHDEGASTNTISNFNNKKLRFRYRKLIQANKILLNEMMKYENE